jgi:hypothetical protein
VLAKPGRAWIDLCELCVFARTSFLQPIDDSRDAVFDEDHVEVDEQAETLVCQPEIGGSSSRG